MERFVEVAEGVLALGRITRSGGCTRRSAHHGSAAQMAEDALAILDALGIERAHVVGLSLGGILVQWSWSHIPSGCSARRSEPD